MSTAHTPHEAEHDHLDHDHDHVGHEHGHGHGYGHGHDHGPVRYDRAFGIGVALNIGYVAIEATAGLIADSVALLADAGHNLSDVMGLLLAWGAMWLSRRRPTEHHTYGYGNSSVLAALTNAVVLLLAAGAITWEAIGRLHNPVPVEPVLIAIVAGGGIVVNAITALLFQSGRASDINLRGAYLHMASDALVSIGVVVGAGIVALTGWLWVDPAISIVIVIVIAVGTWGLLRDSLRLALDGVPPGIDRTEIERYLMALPGVVSVHDLHIWPLSTTETALTVHLVRPGSGPDDALIHRIAQDLKERFRIGHPTIQIEHDAGQCVLAPVDVV